LSSRHFNIRFQVDGTKLIIIAWLHEMDELLLLNCSEYLLFYSWRTDKFHAAKQIMRVINRILEQLHNEDKETHQESERGKERSRITLQRLTLKQNDLDRMDNRIVAWPK
jgi:hypothetical protein